MTEPYRLHEAKIAGRGVNPAGPFQVEVEQAAGGITVIVLRGELDMAATGAVREAVDGAVGAGGAVIDVSEVTFVDSSMLKELLRAGAELSRYETRLVLAAIPPAVKRLLDLTRTTQLFTVVDSREAALQLLRGA